MYDNSKALVARSAQALGVDQFAADPLADETIDKILDDWRASTALTTPEALIAANAVNFERIRQVSRLMMQWDSNATISDWQPKLIDGVLPDPLITAALQTYLKAAQALPSWADPEKLKRAETLFMENGALSCILLFCASLPECYVIPDLATVLHIAGQLEEHTEYRIRATAAMIFPVMMKDGLTGAAGGGIAQTLKVRLIHATIRHLILRGNPQAAVLALQSGNVENSGGEVPPLPMLNGASNMFHALFAHGWKLRAEGLPCNQEELAYTLLTFGYVFLRSLRRLGLGLTQSDEEAYLHAWNLMGHILGIDKALMRDTMHQAQALFTTMQANGRESLLQRAQPDVRAGLGLALMQTMEDAIPLRLFKTFPVLMTRFLCGDKTAQDIGVQNSASWLSNALFTLIMSITRGIDTLVRLFMPEFSLSRLITRVIGYRFLVKVLMDQTRPLKLPEHLLNQAGTVMRTWSDDPKAPRWVNAVEDRLTTTGPWQREPQVPQ